MSKDKKNTDAATDVVETTDAVDTVDTTEDTNEIDASTQTTEVTDTPDENITPTSDNEETLNEVKDDTREEDPIEDSELMIDTSALTEAMDEAEGADKELIRSALQKVEEANAKIRMYLRAQQ